MVAVIIGVLILAIIAVVYFVMHGRNSSTIEDLDTYQNDNVCFSISYPKGYNITEPNDNNVIIIDEKATDMQLSVEYAYSTVGDSAIYSAEDFANQIDMDNDVLRKWIGSDSVDIVGSEEKKVSGKKCYVYDYTLATDTEHTGQVLIFEGKGNVGCYVILWAVSDEAENAKNYIRQCKQMCDTFEVTGKYSVKDYNLNSAKELDINMLLYKDNYDSFADEGSKVKIYPTSSKSEITVYKSEYGSSMSYADVINEVGYYYYEHTQNAEFITGIQSMGFGRYNCQYACLQYLDGTEYHYVNIVTFLCDDLYWIMEADSIDSNYDEVNSCLADIVWSIRVNGAKKYTTSSEGKSGSGTSSSNNDETTVDQTTESEVVNEYNKKDTIMKLFESVKNEEGYFDSEYSDNLVIYNDMNSDGIDEMLVTYHVSESGMAISVKYKLWSLPDGEPILLDSGVFYTEVGGNSASIGVVSYNGTRYFTLESSEPDGAMNHTYCSYLPWAADNKSLTDDGSIYMEYHESYEDENVGTYILGDTYVDKESFFAMYYSMSWMYRIDSYSYGGNGDAVSFADFPSYVEQVVK